MAATVNLELDPIFLKALGFLHSKSKDSAEKLKALLDESLARGIDSSYRPTQKDVEPPKISSTKSLSIKQEPKTSSSLPSGSSNGKVLTAEKIKKEAEKRPADKPLQYIELHRDSARTSESQTGTGQLCASRRKIN